MKKFTKLISDITEGIADSATGTGAKKHWYTSNFEKKSKLLSPHYDGFAIGLDAFTSKQSHSHVMCCAPSSGGKTTKVIVPSIYNIATSHPEGSSIVVNDVKGEIIKQTKAFLKSQGYRVLKLDFRDPARSIAFNPFAYAHTPTELNKTCNLIVGEQNNSGDQFWRQKSVDLIYDIATYLKQNEEVQYHNIANINYILEHLMAEEDTINNMYMSNANPDLWRRFKMLHANSERTKASILSSAISYLSHYALDPDVCDITSNPNSFDFSRLSDQKLALFICLPIQNTYFSNLVGMFFSSMFYHLYDRLPSPNSRKLFVIIDELASIPLPKFEEIIAIARSYFALLFVVQSTEQLYEKYGNHAGNIIINNSTGIYFTGLNHECEKLQNLLGSYTYFPDKKNKYVTQQRFLMSAQEIRTMPKDDAIVVPNGGMKPIYLKSIKPWYKVKKYVDYINMVDPDDFALPLHLNRHRTQYLPLDQYREQQNPNETNTNN